MIIVSKCLLGEKARFDGTINIEVHPKLTYLLDRGEILSFCPEMEGGLDVPRPACEILGDGGGKAVLNHSAKVIDTTAKDLSKPFIEGARQGATLCKDNHIKIAILKERSPSCGSRIIYDGSFSSKQIQGEGVFTTVLTQQGIKVFNDTQIEEALILYEQIVSA